MDTDNLADLLRVEGVVVALVASFLAAPVATRHIWTQLKLRLRKGWRGLSYRVHRLGLWLRGRREVQIHPANMVVEAESVLPMTVSVSASGRVDSGDDLPSRVTRLERGVGEIREEVNLIHQRIKTEAAEHRRSIDELARRSSEDIRSVRDKIAATEENELRVDATALPVVGLGIVLSGIPDLLATWTPLGIAFFIAGLAFLWRALKHFRDKNAP